MRVWFFHLPIGEYRPGGLATVKSLLCEAPTTRVSHFVTSHRWSAATASPQYQLELSPRVTDDGNRGADV